MHRNAPIGEKINIYGGAAIEGRPSTFNLSHIKLLQFILDARSSVCNSGLPCSAVSSASVLTESVSTRKNAAEVSLALQSTAKVIKSIEAVAITHRRCTIAIS